MTKTIKTARRFGFPRESADVVFRPALAPLEASVLPAKERPRGALRHARGAFRLPGEPAPHSGHGPHGGRGPYDGRR